MARKGSGVISIESGRRLRERREFSPEDRLEALRRRWKRLSKAILIAGFIAAAIIFVVARPAPENPLGYDPLDTKSYRRQLEVYGGSANVMAADFMDWFSGLWQGRNLAYTIAVLTLVTVLLVRFFSKLYLQPVENPEDPAAPAGPET